MELMYILTHLVMIVCAITIVFTSITLNSGPNSGLYKSYISWRQPFPVKMLRFPVVAFLKMETIFKVASSKLHLLSYTYEQKKHGKSH